MTPLSSHQIIGRALENKVKLPMGYPEQVCIGDVYQFALENRLITPQEYDAGRQKYSNRWRCACD